MRGRKQREVPKQLLDAAKQFADWRRRRLPGGRIPDRLWSAAVELARTYGVCRTSRLLKLHYYTLKERLDAQPQPKRAPSACPAPAFVELSASALVTPGECVIEWQNVAGARMRVHLKGLQVPDLVALSASFWRGEP